MLTELHNEYVTSMIKYIFNKENEVHPYFSILSFF